MSSGDHTPPEMGDPRDWGIDPNRKYKQRKRREPVASSEQVSAEADSTTKDKQASSSSSSERWLAAGLYDLLSKRPRPDDDLVVEDKSAK